MLDRMAFLVSEAITALRRNRGMALAAISTATVALFFIGGLGYTYLRISQYAASLPGKLEMRVHLVDQATHTDVQTVAAAIRRLDGIDRVVWLPKENMWRKLQQERPEATEGLPMNPLPHAFKITLKKIENSEAVEQQIRAMPLVDPSPNGVQYFREVHQFLDQTMRLIQRFGAILGSVLFLTSGMLIFTAVRLTVVARRLEIRIMQLVGASRFTIHVPFIIEGVVQGTMAGFFASLALFVSNQGLDHYLRNNTKLGELPTFPLWDLTWMLCVIGALYGLVCSAIAVRARLQYR